MIIETEIENEIAWLKQQIACYEEYIKNADNPYVCYEDMLILSNYARRLAKLVPSPYIPPKPILQTSAPMKGETQL